MTIHDWTRVDDGIFHALHVNWTVELAKALNHGILPAGYYALPEQIARDIHPDVLTLHASPAGKKGQTAGEVATLERPQTRHVLSLSSPDYSHLSRIISIRHVSGDDVVAIVELVSRSNKSTAESLGMLVNKTCNALRSGIHVLLVDLHPPGKRDPEGLHAVVWECMGGDASEDVEATPAALSYEAVPRGENFPQVKAHIEPLAVGQSLPDMPLFLANAEFVMAPLQTTYDAAFDALPQRWQDVLATP